MAETVFTSQFAIFKSTTSPEQPAFILDQEIKLLKDCVRSVVYHLKTDKDSLETSLRRQHHMYDMNGVITWASKDNIKNAENKLWKSVMHMKWLKGDGVTLSWFQVKEGEDYRWIRTDHPNRVRFIQERLAEECTRQNLNIDKISHA